MNIDEAIAAVKANPPHPESPMPWRINGKFVEDSNGDDVGGLGYREDAAHIAAAVNAAPVLVAEVEQLQAALAAARVAVEKIGGFYHRRACATEVFLPCNCGAAASNAARIEARRALGLE